MSDDAKRCFLMTLEYRGHVDEYERRLLDTVAWDFVTYGGPVPQKVLDDGYEPDEKDDFGDEDIARRKRCFAVKNSSFDGETLKSQDINDLIAFVARNGLTIVDEGMADDDY